LEYLNAIAQYYLKREMYQEAKHIAEQLISNHPSNRFGSELLAVINERLKDQGS
jgi:outer membrane protein assembly factor BamD (BamD/ComL family)